MPYKDRAMKQLAQLRWWHARKDAWFTDKQCAVCGSSENLELDHINPFLKVSHKIWSWRIERRDEELAKCQVLCKSCHQIKTKTDQRLWRERRKSEALSSA